MYSLPLPLGVLEASRSPVRRARRRLERLSAVRLLSTRPTTTAAAAVAAASSSATCPLVVGKDRVEAAEHEGVRQRADDLADAPLNVGRRLARATRGIEPEPEERERRESDGRLLLRKGHASNSSPRRPCRAVPMPLPVSVRLAREWPTAAPHEAQKHLEHVVDVRKVRRDEAIPRLVEAVACIGGRQPALQCVLEGRRLRTSERREVGMWRK